MLASSSTLPPLPPPPLAESPLVSTPTSPPRRRLPQIPVAPPPPSAYVPPTNLPPAHPPERRASTYYAPYSAPPLPTKDAQHDSQSQGWDNEQREREIAIARSMEEMRLNDHAERERAREQREREQIRQAEEESLRDHLRSRPNQQSWETWEVGRGNGTYDGLANGGPSSYYHTVSRRASVGLKEERAAVTELTSPSFFPSFPLLPACHSRQPQTLSLHPHQSTLLAALHPSPAALQGRRSSLTSSGCTPS